MRGRVALALIAVLTVLAVPASAKDKPAPEGERLHGANHAYTGGNPQGTFVDPVGPDLAHALHDFFVAHPRD